MSFESRHISTDFIAITATPVYETDSAEQIEWILADARVRLVVTESVALAHVVRQAADAFRAAYPQGQEVRVLSLDRDALTTISEAGREVDRRDLDARSRAVRGDDVFSIIYISFSKKIDNRIEQGVCF